MAVLSSGTSSYATQRGPSVGFRFTLYAAASVTLMFLDQRGGWLERARYGLAAIAYPLNLAINSPSAAGRWLQDMLQTRAELQTENAQLRAHQRELEIRALRLEALERENAALRGLKAAAPPLIDKWLPGEIIRTESSSQRQRLLINRGAINGVFKAQAVLTNTGLVGQTLRVGPWTTEVILLTDPEHAVPVQVQRTGLRTIAIGAAEPGYLSLPYLPIQADIRDDDLLVTSGLGGVFPAGYPVARVSEVRRDGSSVLAQVKAVPLADLERNRVIMFVWFNDHSPAAPVGEQGSANTAGQLPQPVPAAVTPVANEAHR